MGDHRDSYETRLDDLSIDVSNLDDRLAETNRLLAEILKAVTPQSTLPEEYQVKRLPYHMVQSSHDWRCELCQAISQTEIGMIAHFVEHIPNR